MASLELSPRSRLREALQRVPVTQYTSIDSMKRHQTSALSGLQSLLHALLPSFLLRPRRNARVLRATSYLDGLRGVAALFVVFNHYVAQFFPYATRGWRSVDGSDATQGANDRLVQLPIVRAIYSGRFMVTIFFVISGYVLSHKALGLARRRDYTPLLKSLSSSVFRRWIRLMLPAIASTLVGLILSRAGLGSKLYSDWDGSTTPGSPPAERTVINARLPDQGDATLQKWLADCLVMADPFQFGTIYFPFFNFPLWTMQVEFMGSMIVFLVVLGTALARQVLQFAILTLLVLFCLWTGRWPWSLFISGVLLSQLSRRSTPQSILPVDSSIEDATEKTPAPVGLPLHRILAFYLPYSSLFLLALYLGTFPEGNSESSPGYRQLAKYSPLSWGLFMGYFYPVIASILLVAVLEHGKFLQKIFTTRIAQYLGDISLSLYMLHIQVLLSLGNWLVPLCVSLTSGMGGFGFIIGMSISLFCCAIVTLWVSDIFWRLVDAKCVKFARWVSEKCFVEDD